MVRIGRNWRVESGVACGGWHLVLQRFVVVCACRGDLQFEALVDVEIWPSLYEALHFAQRLVRVDAFKSSQRPLNVSSISRQFGVSKLDIQIRAAWTSTGRNCRHKAPRHALSGLVGLSVLDDFEIAIMTGQGPAYEWTLLRFGKLARAFLVESFLRRLAGF